MLLPDHAEGICKLYACLPRACLLPTLCDKPPVVLGMARGSQPKPALQGGCLRYIHCHECGLHAMLGRALRTKCFRTVCILVCWDGTCSNPSSGGMQAGRFHHEHVGTAPGPRQWLYLGRLWSSCDQLPCEASSVMNRAASAVASYIHIAWTDEDIGAVCANVLLQPVQVQDADVLIPSVVSNPVNCMHASV